MITAKGSFDDMRYGYDVTGKSYEMRLVGMERIVVLTCLVFYRNHRNRVYKRKIEDVLQEFHLSSSRTKWQLCQILCVPAVLCIAELFKMPRAMWQGIAAMSAILPFMEDMQYRVKKRIVGNIAGVLCFTALYFLLPSSIYAYIQESLAEIGVGFSAKYGWPVLNLLSFSALPDSGNYMELLCKEKSSVSWRNLIAVWSYQIALMDISQKKSPYDLVIWEKLLDPVADKLTPAAMLICLFTRFPHMLLLIVTMAGKELYMAVRFGCLVIRKAGKVHGADWHGKIVTFLLYGNCSGAYYMVPHYTDGIRSVDWFVCYNDGHIS